MTAFIVARLPSRLPIHRCLRTKLRAPEKLFNADTFRMTDGKKNDGDPRVFVQDTTLVKTIFYLKSLESSVRVTSRISSSSNFYAIPLIPLP